jgi:hypothetical protein
MHLHFRKRGHVPRFHLDLVFVTMLVLFMRFLCSLVILALFAGLPFVGVTPTQKLSGETIAAFDICSPHSPGSTDNLSTVSEPVFDITAFMPSIETTENKVIVRISAFATRIDRPPTV